MSVEAILRRMDAERAADRKAGICSECPNPRAKDYDCCEECMEGLSEADRHTLLTPEARKEWDA